MRVLGTALAPGVPNERPINPPKPSALNGEAQPGNLAALFGPLFNAPSGKCKTIREQTLQVKFQLVYFNTVCAKFLMDMVQGLEVWKDNVQF